MMTFSSGKICSISIVVGFNIILLTLFHRICVHGTSLVAAVYNMSTGSGQTEMDVFLMDRKVINEDLYAWKINERVNL